MLGLFRPKFEPPFAPYLMLEEETALPAATCVAEPGTGAPSWPQAASTAAGPTAEPAALETVDYKDSGSRLWTANPDMEAGILADYGILPDSATPVATAMASGGCGSSVELPDFDTLWELNDAESISMLSLDQLPLCSQAMVPISPSAEIVRQE